MVKHTQTIRRQFCWRIVLVWVTILRGWRLKGMICIFSVLNYRTLFQVCRKKWWNENQANIYLFKVNNRNTRKRCEICSKLTIKNTRTTSLTSLNNNTIFIRQWHQKQSWWCQTLSIGKSIFLVKQYCNDPISRSSKHLPIQIKQ